MPPEKQSTDRASFVSYQTVHPMGPSSLATSDNTKCGLRNMFSLAALESILQVEASTCKMLSRAAKLNMLRNPHLVLSDVASEDGPIG